MTGPGWLAIVTLEGGWDRSDSLARSGHRYQEHAKQLCLITAALQAATVGSFEFLFYAYFNCL